MSGGAGIEVVLGNIVDQRVDAIVDPANESLRGGGGADGAIHRAAGPRLAEAGGRLAPCRPGEAKWTPAFDLDPPVKYVIHTVGPRWRGGERGEADVLMSCYRRCLEVAAELGVRSIAFPAISTGVFGYPAIEAARIAVDTLSAGPVSLERIILVAFDAPSYGMLSWRLAGA